MLTEQMPYTHLPPAVKAAHFPIKFSRQNETCAVTCSDSVKLPAHQPISHSIKPSSKQASQQAERQAMSHGVKARNQRVEHGNRGSMEGRAGQGRAGQGRAGQEGHLASEHGGGPVGEALTEFAPGWGQGLHQHFHLLLARPMKVILHHHLQCDVTE